MSLINLIWYKNAKQLRLQQNFQALSIQCWEKTLRNFKLNILCGCPFHSINDPLFPTYFKISYQPKDKASIPSLLHTWSTLTPAESTNMNLNFIISHKIPLKPIYMQIQTKNQIITPNENLRSHISIETRDHHDTYSSFFIFRGQSLGSSPGNDFGCTCNEWGKYICKTYKRMKITKRRGRK